MIQAHAAAGNRAAAMTADQACRTVLARELGVAPSPETVALATSLVQSEASLPRSPAIAAAPALDQVIRRARPTGGA